MRRKHRTGNTGAVNSYLSCDSRPDFQRVVVGAADDAVATELEAGDHVVIVTFQHLWEKETGWGGQQEEGGRGLTAQMARAEGDSGTTPCLCCFIHQSEVEIKRKMSSSAAGARQSLIGGVCVCVCSLFATTGSQDCSLSKRESTLFMQRSTKSTVTTFTSAAS